jgi:hypothetical protein
MLQKRKKESKKEKNPKRSVQEWPQLADLYAASFGN